MAEQNEQSEQYSEIKETTNSPGPTNLENPVLERLSKELLPDADEQPGNSGEITNNDGSVIETLDTAFHNQPGMIKGHSVAGSNRADYYEERSAGKSDSEEELDALKEQ